MTFCLRFTRFSSTSGVLLALACGDSGGGSASESAGSSSSTDASGSSGTSAASSSSTTESPTTGGGQTGSSGSTGSTGPITGTSAGETTDASGTSGTSEGTGTSGTETGSSGSTGGGVTKSCLPADFPVSATLCGGPGPSCALKRDEVVSAKTAFRNDAPAVALRGDCGPAVLFSEAVGGYFGFYAERTGPDAWAVEATPMTVATGSLEVDAEKDEAIALVDDGAFGVSLWRRVGGKWGAQGALPGKNHARSLQMLRDPQGALQVGHIDDNQVLFASVFDGGWSKGQIDKEAEIHARLALTGAGDPRLVYWSSAKGTWTMLFAAPPAAPEQVGPLGSNVLDRHHSSLALAADDTPWLVYNRKQPDQVHHEVVLAHREGPAKWASETLAAEALVEATCDGMPDGPGQTCEYDYTRLYAMAAAASADQVRALYLAIRYKGTMVSQCQPMPFPFCVWTPQSDMSSAELRIAWPGSKPAEHEVVAQDLATDRMTARLDPAGDIHLAFYDYPFVGGDPTVRYLMIGPS